MHGRVSLDWWSRERSLEALLSELSCTAHFFPGLLAFGRALDMCTPVTVLILMRKHSKSFYFGLQVCCLLQVTTVASS